MAKTEKARWAIFLVRERAELLGTVEAPDQETAIKVAIQKYNVTDAKQQKQLIARPYR